MSETLPSHPGRSPSATMSESVGPPQPGLPKNLAYKDPSAFLDYPSEETFIQTLSLTVTET